MGKTDFDNIIKTIKGEVTLSGGNVVSVEIDFELPRGFIAKIKDYELGFRDLHEDLEGLGVAEQVNGIHMCLLRDPDDITTVLIPNNEVQHDAIDEFTFTMHTEITGTQYDARVMSAIRKWREFNKEDDIVTARNMRLNAVAVGTNAGNLTETVAQAIIHYTLEKVTDADILDLLDIL